MSFNAKCWFSMDTYLAFSLLYCSCRPGLPIWYGICCMVLYWLFWRALLGLTRLVLEGLLLLSLDPSRTGLRKLNYCIPPSTPNGMTDPFPRWADFNLLYLRELKLSSCLLYRDDETLFIWSWDGALLLLIVELPTFLSVKRGCFLFDISIILMNNFLLEVLMPYCFSMKKTRRDKQILIKNG